MTDKCMRKGGQLSLIVMDTQIKVTRRYLICQNDYSQKIKEKGCENVDKLEIG